LVFALGVVVGTHTGPASGNVLQTGRGAEAREGAAAYSPPSRRQVAELSGSGDQSAGPFDLLEGPAFLAIQFDGKRTFRARLVNERREATSPVDSPDGFIGGMFGPWKVRTVAQITANGRYFLEVSGEGDWKVAVTQ